MEFNPSATDSTVDQVKFQEWGRILSHPTIDLKQKLTVALKISNSVEVFQTNSYSYFLQALVPVFEHLLRHVTPSLQSNSDEQQVRKAVLEVIHRLPGNEIFLPYVHLLMKLLLDLLRVENEENAVLCLKIIIDLHRTFKVQLEDYVLPFLGFVKELYQNMKEAVETTFKSRPIQPPSQSTTMLTTTTESLGSMEIPSPTAEMLGGGHESHPKMFGFSLMSFKVLTECPIIIVLLFQNYRKFVQPNISELASLIIGMLTLQAKPQLEAQAQAAAQDQIFYGVSPHVDAVLFTDFIVAQVKSLSFLAYMLRSYPLKLASNVIPEVVIRLLRECPPDASGTRKELLVATRHILSTDYRNQFIHQMDLLLDERLLIGDGYTSFETLRPLAYSMLADLVHHVRGHLSPQQLARTITIYSRNLHDVTLAPSIQTMCAKLLLNLIDRVIVVPDRTYARRLLVQILTTFVEKITTLCSQIGEESEDDPKDIRFLFKNLITGTKTILFGFIHLIPPAPEAPFHVTAKIATGFSREEADLFVRLFKDGLCCFEYFGTDEREIKETLDHFINVFVCIDPAVFQEIFVSQLDHLINKTVTLPVLINIPQSFLANELYSANFAGALIRYLVDKITVLGDDDGGFAETLLKLFKLMFMALLLFPEANEPVLQPYLGKIILSCMKMSAGAPVSKRYFLLLRALFRNIGGGRFELLYKEVLPLLQFMLESFNALLELAEEEEMRELFVELSLTVPVRLSVLLPFLSYLMKPLVYALKAGPELVGQGLRTLELCIDNLTQEFLDPILSPVLDELMVALYNHLRPSASRTGPGNHLTAQSTMKILGKLGGRNRRFRNGPQLYTKEPLTFDLRIQLPPGSTTSGCGTEVKLDLLSVIPVLERTLEVVGTEGIEEETLAKKDAFVMLRFMLSRLLTFTSLTTTITTSSVTSTIANTAVPMEGIKKEIMKELEVEDFSKDKRWVLRRVFYLILVAASPEAEEFLKELTGYLASESESVETTAFLDALLEGLCSTRKAVRDITEKAFSSLFTATMLKQTRQDELYGFVKKLCSLCYEADWNRKRGGCLGVTLVSVKVDWGCRFLLPLEIELVKALLFILKDTPLELMTEHVAQTRRTLSHLLKVCNEQGVEDDVTAQERFTVLTSVLVAELSSPNETLRKTVQDCFELLADLTGNEVTELLMPVKDHLLLPIFQNPLRALPIQMQIGNIDAVTYCLNLRPPILEANDALVRLLHEALGLADAEDTALLNRPQSIKHANTVGNLRIVCIKLLSASMSCADLNQAANQAATRSKIIAVFFKSLYSKSPEVVEVANKGLKQVLTHSQKLPKDLLQEGLRPILNTLSDHRRLTVSGLECLALLLELLIQYFRPEIGNKLLDHMKQWADPAVLSEYAGKPLSEVPEVQVLCAILDIFHLLPPSANAFLPELVQAVLEMEQQVRRDLSSPFRRPLLKYLNRFPKETVGFFLLSCPPALLMLGGNGESMSSRLSLFLRLLEGNSGNSTSSIAGGVTAGGAVNDALLKETIKAMDQFSLMVEPLWQNLQVRLFFIRVVHALVDACGADWLCNPTVGANNSNTLRLLLIPTTNTATTAITISEEEEKHLNAVLMTIVTKDSQQNLSALFYLSRRMDQKTRHFIKQQVKSTFGFEFKRLILEHFFTLLEENTGETLQEDVLAGIIRGLINPVVASLFGEIPNDAGAGETFLFGMQIIGQTQRLIWKKTSFLSKSQQHRHNQHRLDIELLQLTACLIQKGSWLLSDVKKDVIKFIWHLTRSEDVLVKHAAYLVLARFIAVFETPQRITAQVFISLLHAHQTEARSLIREALDVLTPVIPTRVISSTIGTASAGSGEGAGGIPIWVQWTRQVLIEDGHAISQLVNIYTLLVQHQQLFGPYRSLFVPYVISTLPKLALLANATIETKTLAFDLVDLIISWELLASSGGSGLLHKHLQELLIQFLVNFSCTPSTASSAAPGSVTNVSAAGVNTGTPLPPAPPQVVGGEKEFRLATFQINLIRKALRALRRLRALGWDLSAIPMKSLEPQLCTTDEFKNTVQICAALDMLYMLLTTQSEAWIMEHMGALQRLLERPIRSSFTQITAYVCPLLAWLQRKFPIREDELFYGIYLMVDQVIQDALNPNVGTSLGHNQTPNPSAMPSSAAAAAAAAALYSSSSATSNFASNNPMAAAVAAAAAAAAGATPVGSVIKATPLLLLAAFVDDRPDFIDPYLASLARLLQYWFKEHLRRNFTGGSGGGALSAIGGVDVLGLNMMGLISLMNLRTSFMNETRRSFLHTLVQLMEHSTSVPLLQGLLNLVRGWVLFHQEAYPTLKEKANLMSTMTVFTLVEAKLKRAFLELVAQVYESPMFGRTEMTVQLEGAFLAGLVTPEVGLRDRFLRLLHESINQCLFPRLHYLLGVQNWEALAKTFWLTPLLEMLLVSVVGIGASSISRRSFSAGNIQSSNVSNGSEFRGDTVMEAFRHLLHRDDMLCATVWAEIFPQVWTQITGKERQEINKDLIPLLSQAWHGQLAYARPNPIQAILEGLWRAKPSAKLPPSMVKYFGKAYGTWYVSLVLLEEDSSSSATESMAELYEVLGEEDFYYGLWRRRVQVSETGLGLMLEQQGRIAQAQAAYETAQVRVLRSPHHHHALTQSQSQSQQQQQQQETSEFDLWTRRWTECAMKLQQWDILYDLGKSEHSLELTVEAAWRMTDSAGVDRETMLQALQALTCNTFPPPTMVNPPFPSSSIAPPLPPSTGITGATTVPAAAAVVGSEPRYKALEAFYLVSETYTEKFQLLFQKSQEEARLLALAQWQALPIRVSTTQERTLHLFQQLVELKEAQDIYALLFDTNAGNFDVRYQEVKAFLQSWRERLPNPWDDLNLWSDLVSWRQLVFHSINRAYMPLAPMLPPSSAPPSSASASGGGTGGGGANANGGGDSPSTSNASATAAAAAAAAAATLSSYAYRGFHEFAWIINRFAHVNRKHGMLDVAQAQLAKIYTLPNIEIQEAFIKLKEQARCHYALQDYASGLEVISNTNLLYFTNKQKAEFCVLKGWFLYQLGLGSDANTAFSTATQCDLGLAKAWIYWARYFDRLYSSSSANGGGGQVGARAMDCYLQAACTERQLKAKRLIVRILWLLSSCEEEGEIVEAFVNFKGELPMHYWQPLVPQLLHALSTKPYISRLIYQLLGKLAKVYPQALHYHVRTAKDELSGESGVVEYLEDLMEFLKTSFPLQTLSIELMMNELGARLKPFPEEDIYRFVSWLYYDAVQQASVRFLSSESSEKDLSIPSSLASSLKKLMAAAVGPFKSAFERDFSDAEEGNLMALVEKLSSWKSRLESFIKQRQPLHLCLEQLSVTLSAFEYQRLEDVDLPGQSLLWRDLNEEPIRIERFLPLVQVVPPLEAWQGSTRRIFIQGQNGIVFAYTLQHPSPKSSRLEERVLTLLSLWNQILDKKRFTRKRRISFPVPIIVPLTPQVRMSSFDTPVVPSATISCPATPAELWWWTNRVSLQQVYAAYSSDEGQGDALLFYLSQLSVISKLDAVQGQSHSLRLELFDTLCAKKKDYLVGWLSSIMLGPEDYWLWRKRFTQDLSAWSFLAHVLGLAQRIPLKFQLCPTSGKVYQLDLVPQPGWSHPEPVPFRLTPPIQELLSPSLIEGVFFGGITAIAQSLLDSENELEDYLSFFIQDEPSLILPSSSSSAITASVLTKVSALALPPSSTATDSHSDPPHPLLNLISKATDPSKLALTDLVWQPWV